MTRSEQLTLRAKLKVYSYSDAMTMAAVYYVQQHRRRTNNAEHCGLTIYPDGDIRLYHPLVGVFEGASRAWVTMLLADAMWELCELKEKAA